MDAGMARVLKKRGRFRHRRDEELLEESRYLNIDTSWSLKFQLDTTDGSIEVHEKKKRGGTHSRDKAPFHTNSAARSSSSR
jgi:hypothetical protein